MLTNSPRCTASTPHHSSWAPHWMTIINPAQPAANRKQTTKSVLQTYILALMMGSRKYHCCFIYEHKQPNPAEIL